MTKLLNCDAIVGPGTASQASRTADPRPILCLTWALDPTTGRPVARWIIEGSQPAGGLAFAAAA
jgi:hypothetical protein